MILTDLQLVKLCRERGYVLPTIRTKFTQYHVATWVWAYDMLPVYWRQFKEANSLTDYIASKKNCVIFSDFFRDYARMAHLRMNVTEPGTISVGINEYTEFDEESNDKVLGRHQSNPFILSTERGELMLTTFDAINDKFYSMTQREMDTCTVLEF